LLVDHFLLQLNKDKNTDVSGVTDSVIKTFMHHPWPGNVRELANLMERMVVLKGEGEINIDDLPPKMRQCGDVGNCLIAPELSTEGICLSTAVSEFEKNLIYQSLEKTDWVKKQGGQVASGQEDHSRRENKAV
jgi:DNA-binding NtrC family response regulator